MPALEALLDRFAAVHTQPLGISVDSIHCHANWAESLGGISFPLLADFHPKGGVAKAFGLYLEDVGITDRATVIIDAGGIVRHVSSVTPAGERDIAELAQLCEEIDAEYQGELSSVTPLAEYSQDTTLYVRSRCGFSRNVLLARCNLHLEDRIPVKNVSEDSAAMAELLDISGQEKAPCLVVDGKAMLESQDIVKHLVSTRTGF